MRVAPEWKRRRLSAPVGLELQDKLVLGCDALEPSSDSEDEAPVHLGATSEATALVAGVLGQTGVALGVQPEDESAEEAAASDACDGCGAKFQLAEVPTVARTYVARVVANLRRLSRTILRDIIAASACAR